jgi:hypothetical protein
LLGNRSIVNSPYSLAFGYAYFLAHCYPYAYTNFYAFFHAIR